MSLSITPYSGNSCSTNNSNKSSMTFQRTSEFKVGDILNIKPKPGTKSMFEIWDNKYGISVIVKKIIPGKDDSETTMVLGDLGIRRRKVIQSVKSWMNKYIITEEENAEYADMQRKFDQEIDSKVAKRIMRKKS